MKKRFNPNTKSPKVNFTGNTFYNYRNNDFLKTNAFLDHSAQFIGSPDDLQLDSESQLRLLKNNQEISGNLNSKKFSDKLHPSMSARNFSSPQLRPIDLTKVKGMNPNQESSVETGFSSSRTLTKKGVILTSPRYQLGSSNSFGVSPVTQINSARVSTAAVRGFSDNNAQKSIMDMTPEELAALEKQVLAKTKLIRDKNQILSRMNTKSENKRDVSYISEAPGKGFILPSQAATQTALNNNGEARETRIRNTTPELTLRNASSEKTPKSHFIKRNTNDVTIFEDPKPSMFLPERKRAGTMNKKGTLDVYQNVLSANGSLPSLSGLHSNNETMVKTQTGFMKGAGESSFVPKKTMRADILVDGSKIDPEELINELKRELPSVLTTAPASRQEVVVLSNWMDKKCKEVNENIGIKEEEKSMHIDKIYNVCINEVFRQVSLDCAERGELLYKIWMGYLQMFLQRKTGLEDEIQRLKTYYENENQKQYEWSQKLITKRDMEIEDCKMELQKALKEKDDDNKHIDKLNKKNVQLKQKTEQLKSLLAIMKSQMEELKEENRLYAKRQAYKVASNTKGTSVPTFLTHKESNKEAPGTENLVLMTGTTPKPGLVSSIAGFKTMADAASGSNSSDSDESSMDFVYEDALMKSKEVFKIDLLNTNALAFKTVTNLGSPHGPGGETITVLSVHTATKETQTGLQLLETKYDSIFETQKGLDELMSELKLKREVDVLAEAELLGGMELSPSGSGSEKSKRQSFEVADSVIEGEGGDATVKSILLPGEQKKKTMNEAAMLSPRSLLFNTEKGSSKTLNLTEEDKSPSPEGRRPSLKMTSPNGKTFLSIFEPIQEQLNEDAKSVAKSQTKIQDPDDSLRRDTVYEINAKQPLFIPERRKTSLTPVQKTDGSAHTSHPKEANSSFDPDDPFQSLNDAASDSAEEEKEEASMYDPSKKHLNIGASFDAGHQNTSITNASALMRNLEGFEVDSEGKRSLSIGTIANAKTHAMSLVAALHAKKEDVGVVDKAKMMTILRMYKVETQKNQALKNSIVELEEQIINEKETQTKLQENIGELNVHIKMLEALKAKCPHGRCYVCRGDKNDDLTEADSSKQNLEASVGDKASEGDMQDKELIEDGIDEDEEGSLEDEEQLSEAVETQGDGTQKAPRGFNRGKKKKATLTKGQQPDFAKKKQNNGNQIYSAALGILMKIKDKKLTKFKNFMPIKSVLKQINTLYNERISQAKENAIIKEEEFFVFVYKWFFNNFGFRKIAEQKYIIFVLSVKKYLHIVRINLFARFMTLLQGPSNFNLDEFNRYLEGIEFIHNSTLGSPIVNNETDSKMYAPFLRGLEYLRNFADNKMATEEYIEFKREFEAIKESDPKNINRNGIVDIDLFMTKVLTKYRIICNRTKQFVVNAFKAADLDGNKYCSLKEFLMIYRNIEHEKYDEGFAENLFNEHADIKLQGEINLSFDKFTVVCVEYGLFSDVQQDLFLGVQNAQEIEDKMRSLKNQWSLHYFEVDRKLSEAEKITKEEKQYWFSILKVLNERLTESESLDPKPLLIAFKILDQEVERLVDNEAERDMYGVRIHKFESKES